MTTGNLLTGTRGPYTDYSYKTWDGADDPIEKSSWNNYVVSAGRLTHVTSPQGYNLGVGFLLDTWTADDELRLLDKLATAVRSHEFHAGVFLGTSHQLTKQVVATARGLALTASHLKRFDLPGALRSLARSVSADDRSKAAKRLSSKDIAGAHLALQYGWLPTFADLRNAAVAFESITSPPRRSQVTVARSVTREVEISQSPLNYTCPSIVKRSKRYIYLMEEELSTARSLGLTDPYSVAWELMPWSFVADWFVPIGTYIGALGVIPSLKGEFRCQERSSARLAGCVVNHINPPPYDFYADADARGIETRYSRSKSSGLSVPLPRFRGFDQLTNNEARIKNAVALVRQLYR